MGKDFKTALLSAITLISLTGVATSASSQTAVHPVIGDKVSRDTLAQDILNLPERERQAWVHGAVTLMVQTMALYDREQAKCIQGWYFAGSGAEVIDMAFREYSDRYATSLVIVAAQNVCKKAD